MPETETNETTESNAINDYKTVTHTCRVRLTKDEKLVRADEMIENRNAADHELLRFSEIKNEHKKELSRIEKSIMRLHHALESGWEWRDMECYEKPDFRRGLIEIVRFDTGETVATRDLSEKERQESLFA